MRARQDLIRQKTYATKQQTLDQRKQITKRARGEIYTIHHETVTKNKKTTPQENHHAGKDPYVKGSKEKHKIDTGKSQKPNMSRKRKQEKR